LSKLQELSVGLESYTTSTSSVESSKGENDEGRSAALEQIADVVLSEDGNYVQELLLRETAVALDASVRDALTSPLMSLSRIGNLPNTEIIEVPGILRPLTLPLELVKATLELQSVDERDQRRLENVRIMTNLLGNNASAEGSSSDGKDKGTKDKGTKVMERNNNTSSLNMNIINRDTANSVGTLVQEAAKRRMALARIGMRFGGSLATVQAERLRERATRSSESSTEAKASSKNENHDNTTHHRVSKLAERLATRGADRLEGFADAISSFESTLGTRGRN